MNRKLQYRWFFYITGLVVLALGLTLNTKAGLGVSPIISVSYTISELLHNSFANMTLLLYCFFVLMELVLHRLKQKSAVILLQDLLQIPLSLLFTRLIDVFEYYLPDFSTAYVGHFAGSLLFRIGLLLIAIVLTGVGAAMSMNMRIVANPGDGIVQVLADCTGKNVGLMKNCVDASCILVAVCISLTATHTLIGVGLGTILAMIGTGRVIAVFNYLCMQKMLRCAGLPTR